MRSIQTILPILVLGLVGAVLPATEGRVPAAVQRAVDAWERAYAGADAAFVKDFVTECKRLETTFEKLLARSLASGEDAAALGLRQRIHLFRALSPRLDSWRMPGDGGYDPTADLITETWECELTEGRKDRYRLYLDGSVLREGAAPRRGSWRVDLAARKVVLVWEPPAKAPEETVQDGDAPPEETCLRWANEGRNWQLLAENGDPYPFNRVEAGETVKAAATPTLTSDANPAAELVVLEQRFSQRIDALRQRHLTSLDTVRKEILEALTLERLRAEKARRFAAVEAIDAFLRRIDAIQGGPVEGGGTGGEPGP